MPCYFPKPAWPDLATGRWVFTRSSKADLGAEVQAPCGQCEGCRRDRAAQQAVRCMHEAHFYDRSCFLTLTFDDENFPRSQSEWERSVVLFIKRLRKQCADVRVMTFGCLELGESTQRPHAHLLVFGWDFSRDEPMARGHSGDKVFRSYELDKLWPHGHASVGNLSRKSAGYVARYTMKKRSFNDALGQFVAVPHPLTGELIPFKPSLSIGRSKCLGKRWFLKYGEQSIREGYLIVSAKQVPVPDYYKRLAKRYFPHVGADAQCEALERVQATAWDRTPERLAVRRQVDAARTRMLKRGTL